MIAKILVIDDNPVNLKLVSELLEFEGHMILKAEDAEEAQVVLAGTLPELILMDIALPGMDGLTFTRKLKADERTRHIRIVALTAFAMKGDDQKAFDAGCDGYITKPIDTRKLPEQVAEWLAKEAKAIKILIVDDIATNRNLLRVTLEAEGHTMLEAADGLEALQILARDTVDAVISDILMPNMDGFRLCHTLRQSERLHALPFIIYTSTYTSPEDMRLAETVGADKYLTKPAPTAEVLKALRHVMEQKATRPVPSAPVVEETYVLRQYSQALVSKLEEKNAELALANQALKRSQQLLRALTQRAVQAQEAERGRVALELHDTVSQMLCAALFRSQVLAEKLPARNRLAKGEAIKLREILGKTVEEVERISLNLSPIVLDHLGLVAGLQDAGTEFATRTGVSTKLVCVELTGRLPAEIELTLYRILQETLKNVEKHASARHVIVHLTRPSNMVNLTINDDGIGFDPDHYPARREGKGGLGLLGMRERALFVGGVLKIKSVLRVGTEIEVHIPLPPEYCGG